MLRSAGKIAAGATLLGDVAKGVLPILIAMELNAPPVVLALCGLCAFLGHLYPIYFDFRGGKGVATALGVVLTLHLTTGILIITTWLTTMAITRTASIAALISWVFAPFFFQMTAPAQLQSSYLPIIATLSLLLILSHRSNMLNLYRGEEHRFEDTPDPDTPSKKEP